VTRCSERRSCSGTKDSPLSFWNKFRPWARWLTAVLLALTIAHFAQGFLPIWNDHRLSMRTDFVWYQVAFHTVWFDLEPWRNLYNLPFQQAWVTRQHVPYNDLDLYSYPPQFAVLFAPLGALPYQRARQLWTLFTLVAFVVSLLVSASFAAPTRRWLRVGLIALGLLFFPALTAFYWGQDDTIILALLSVGLWLVFARRRPFWGGTLLGLAAVLKVTPAIAILYLLVAGWRRHRRGDPGASTDLRAAAGGIGLALLSVPVCALAVGWRPFVTYVTATLPAIEAVAFVRGPAPMNQSFRGVLALLIHNGTILSWASIAFAAVVFGALLVRGNQDRRVEAAGIALLPLLCSPSIEAHHLVLAIPAEMLIAAYLVDVAMAGTWPWRMAVPWMLGVALLSIPGIPFTPPVGRPLFGPPGVGLLPMDSQLTDTLSNGQHFWAIALLFGAVLLAQPLETRGPTVSARQPVVADQESGLSL